MSNQTEIDEAYRLYDKALELKLTALRMGWVQEVAHWADEQARQRNIIVRLVRASHQPAPTPATQNEVQA